MLQAARENRGAVLEAKKFRYRDVEGVKVAEPVGPAIGAKTVRLQVIELKPGAQWNDASTSKEENVVVVFSGSGTGDNGGDTRLLEHGSAMYAPTGSRVAFTANTQATAVIYVWRSQLMPGRRVSKSPRLFGTLWDTETQLKGFTGTGQADAEIKTATMNFIFWPGVGCSQLCLHCGIMEPGEVFNIHVHPESDEAFFAFSGNGQLYLYDRWVDAEAGDVLFAPPGVPHGTRNTSERRFVTCGGPTPFDPVLYERAGVTTEVQ